MLPFILIMMLMNVDTRDNCIHVLIGLFLLAIAYFAWRSTNIRELPHYHTVLLLNRRLRRRTTRTRLSTHIESSSIVSDLQTEATSSTSNSDNRTSENNQSTEANKPPEPNTSSSGSENINTDNLETVPTENTVEETEFETIVEIMDADAIEVRRRRLAYYENQHQDTSLNPDESSNQPLGDTTVSETVVESLENIADEPIMEHNYAEREVIDTIEIESKSDNKNKVHSDPPGVNSDSIRIKLKYLNDELKLVDGRLEEQLGDFKRRHFHLEFSSNKLVRLIFNGQVLQPDSETLQSCGLFDNCVVHCLIHQQRNVSNDGNTDSATSGTNTGLPHSNNNNNNQGRDWDLGNILFALVSLILTSAWYFRYEYAHLYNVTATIALVAITGIFTIFLVGVYFPDYEQPRVPRQ